MSRVGFLYDDIFLKHNTGRYHPETSDRLRSILEHIEPFEETLVKLSPQPATHEQLLSVHPEAHIDRIKYAAMREEPIDMDTILSQFSYEAALKAAGAGIVAVDAIVEKKIESAFCAVRPPGHHATIDRAMGFCLFNNIAITAKYAQSRGFKKVLIVDFDVHHGNGTQDIFYVDSSVFYFSTHQYPAYPGSGNSSEMGEDEGEGFTLNFPLLPESMDEDILEIYRDELPIIVDEFQPDIILVSAGYDIHQEDPLAELYISTDAIEQIVSYILQSSDVPKIFMLEGGYNLEALGESVARTIEVMLEQA